MKFTKTNAQEMGPSGAVEPCVIYEVTDASGASLGQRMQWPSIQEGSEREKQLRPHFWGDRGWKFATVVRGDSGFDVFGFAKSEAHAESLRERAAKMGAQDFTVLPLS